MIIHRPKLRWSPKLGHIIMHRRICPSIRDRLRRWREAVNAVTLWDDNRPKIKNLVCWGGGGVTVCVPVAFRNKCERVTGPERVRSIFAGHEVWTQHERVERDRNGTGTGPEREPEQVWTRPNNLNYQACHSVGDLWIVTCQMGKLITSVNHLNLLRCSQG